MIMYVQIGHFYQNLTKSGLFEPNWRLLLKSLKKA